MPFEAFRKYFTDLSICYYEDNYEYVVAKTECEPEDPVYFKMTVYSSGIHYITINQESK